MKMLSPFTRHRSDDAAHSGEARGTRVGPEFDDGLREASPLPPRGGPRIISVVGTRAGIGASTFAFHLAYELADEQRVLLIDLDEAGGTLAEACHVDGRLVIERSVENFYIGTAVPAERIRTNAIPITDRRDRFHLIPGRRPQLTELGWGQHVILPRLHEGLRQQDVDVVVLDLGPCLGAQLASAAAAIRSISDRVVGVLTTDPLVIQHAVQLLRTLDRELLADWVCWRWGTEWARHTEEVWQAELPGQPIRAWLDWSDRAYNRWLRTAQPSFEVRDVVRRHLLVGQEVHRS